MLNTTVTPNVWREVHTMTVAAMPQPAELDGDDVLELPDPLPDSFPPVGPDGMWGLREIAQVAGVKYAAVTKWRNNRFKDLAAGRRPGTASLPKQDDTLETGHVHGYPRYKPETVIRWLRQTGRMDREFRPVLLTHRSSGGSRQRPPGQRTTD